MPPLSGAFLRFCLKIVLLFTLVTQSYAYFPFMGEDAQTIGRPFGFELENNLTYFRYYDGTYHQDYIFQLAVGVKKNLDLAVFVPYSKFYDGSELEGLNDSGFYMKHVPYKRDFKFGYLLQINFDTGKEGIGYGKTTGNLNLIGEIEAGGTIYNANIVYIKSGHVEELRDSYGVILGVFKEYRDVLSYGVELKVLRPEDRDIQVLDTHILAGVVYHHKPNKDIALGVHKTLTEHTTFVDYGVLLGLLTSF